MKTIALAAVAASLAMSLPAVADDAHHPEKPAQAAGAAAQLAPQIATMQKAVDRMRSQLDGVARAKTDADRQQAMAEFMRTMQESMGMARAMQSSMMGGCPLMEGGMMGPGGMGMMRGGPGMMGQGPMGPGMSGHDDWMAKRMEMMETRMDMMQMMMQGRMGPPAGAPAKPAK